MKASDKVDVNGIKNITLTKLNITREIPYEYEKKLNEFMSYLIDCEKAKNTRISYEAAIRTYFKYFDDISKANMVKFKEIQLEKVKPRTVELRCKAMNRFCDFLGMEECKVKRPKIFAENTIENVPSLNEYYYLLECLKRDGKIKMYWMVRFLASTGV